MIFARRHAFHGTERHQQGAGFAETHHLGRQRRIAAPLDLRPGAHRQPRQTATRLDEQAAHSRDSAIDRQGIDPFHGRQQAAQCLTLQGKRVRQLFCRIGLKRG